MPLDPAEIAARMEAFPRGNHSEVEVGVDRFGGRFDVSQMFPARK